MSYKGVFWEGEVDFPHIHMSLLCRMVEDYSTEIYDPTSGKWETPFSHQEECGILRAALKAIGDR